MSLEITEYRLRFGRPLVPSEATHLRGFFGHVCADEPLLHHHRQDGRLLYDYPRVQFKVLDRVAHLIGIAEGGAIVEQLWRQVDAARLGAEELPVLEGTLGRRREPFGEVEQSISYRFCSPWLALNQENHRRYEAFPGAADRQALLERILIGNCLALAKSFCHRVAARLTADAGGLRPARVRLKGVSMLGFRGTFRINFALPGHIGIGKSVSRGFGTVESLGQGVESC
ncbi:MAG: CRISPR-associated endonuclease Cas6 [Gemmataceae bacterium]